MIPPNNTLARVTLLATFAWLTLSVFAEEKSLTSDELIALVAKLETMTLVTPEPMKMNPGVFLLCRRPDPKEYDHAVMMRNPEAVYRVYVTPGGADAMKDKKAAFPLGTVILKQKLKKKDETLPELYTGMLKREKGFNPDCGDWEFFLVSGDGKTITDRGKIKSCMDCHVRYPDSDFVTKKYLKN